jgi:DHA3 family multidrug efflux protein-like MFS transporter
MKTFYHLLANTTIAGVINFTVWFAITFFIYLQTHSVFATGIISGIYLILVAVTGIWFGSIVDNHKKKTVMLVSSFVSLILYAICLSIYIGAPDNTFATISSPILWIFVVLLLIGIVTGNIRNIALPTTVTFLVPEKTRDKANGLVGTAFGISFLITSVISGYLVGRSGMFHVLLLAVFATILVMIHLSFVSVNEKKLEHHKNALKKIDLKGTIKIILSIRGLTALIIFNIINNLLGGVFMALMDAYGLSLVSVEMWGMLWGILSTAFIIGGLVIAKVGLGKNPMRTLFIANIIVWTVSIFFTIIPSIFILALGMFIYLVTMPFIEASEQTVIQKVVPAERQGRVFGFAESVEQMASPLTAFLIGPITQIVFIPFMTTGKGADTIGRWFGTGPDRGIALVFIITGCIGLTCTILAMRSKYYHQLSATYLKS